MKYLFTVAVLIVIFSVSSLQSVYCAEGEWKKEFEDICKKTDVSMSLPTDELKDLVGRCDRLKAVIDGQDESTRKVYRKRLQLCRDLYDFVLKSREQEKK